MSFLAIIHSPKDAEQMDKLQKSVAQFRAQKAAKYLGAMGVTYDTICECLNREKIHKTNSK